MLAPVLRGHQGRAQQQWTVGSAGLSIGPLAVTPGDLVVAWATCSYSTMGNVTAAVPAGVSDFTVLREDHNAGGSTNVTWRMLMAFTVDVGTSSVTIPLTRTDTTGSSIYVHSGAWSFSRHGGLNYAAYHNRTASGAQPTVTARMAAKSTALIVCSDWNGVAGPASYTGSTLPGLVEDFTAFQSSYLRSDVVRCPDTGAGGDLIFTEAAPTGQQGFCTVVEVYGYNDTASASIEVANLGGGSADWQASRTQAWLTLSPTAGTSMPSEPVVLTATADPVGQSPGTLTDTITITSSSGTGSPQTIPVSFEVTKVVTKTGGGQGGASAGGTGTAKLRPGGGVARPVGGGRESYPSRILRTAGLISYWRLNEPTGLFQDSKGTNHASAVGAGLIRGVAGLLENDPNLAVTSVNPSATSLITIPSSASMDVTTQLTVEFWCRPGALPVSASSYPITRNDVSGAFFIRHYNAGDGRWEFNLRDSANNTRTVTTSAGTFPPRIATPGLRQHVVLTYDSTVGLRVYINGVLAASGAVTASPNLITGGALTIGDRPSGATPFNGTLDEVALYNVALSASEAAAHYSAGAFGGTDVAFTAVFPYEALGPAYTKVGGGQAVGRPGGVQAVQATVPKTGGGQANALAGGTKQVATALQKAGGGQGVAVAGGPKVFSAVITKTGGGQASAVTGGTKAVAPAKTGGGLAIGQPGGTKLVGGPYREVILSTGGLVSYWRLGEGSGNAVDSKDSNPATTFVGGITRNAPGLLSQDADGAVRSNGANGTLVTIPSASNLSTGAQLTVECWVKPTTLKAAGIACRQTTQPALFWVLFQYADGRLSGEVRDTNNIPTTITTAAGVAVAGATQHLVLVYDAAGVFKFYINGVSVGTPDRTPNLNTKAGGPALGLFQDATDYTAGTGPSYDGTIDEFALYSSALSQAVVQSHYSAGTPTITVGKTGGGQGGGSAGGTKGVLPPAKAGGGQAVMAAGGPKVEQAAKTGGGQAVGVPGGTKVASTSGKPGGGQATGVPGGTKAVTLSSKPGGGQAVGKPGGTKIAARAGTGGGQAGGAPGGTKIATRPETGGGQAGGAAGGTGVRTGLSTKTGGGVAVGVPGGTKVARRTGTGGGVAGTVAGGGKAAARPTTGGGVAVASTGGSKVSLLLKTGGGFNSALAGAAKAVRRTGTGGGVMGALAGGVRALVRVYSGGGVAQAVAGGTSLFQVATGKVGGGQGVGRPGGTKIAARQAVGGGQAVSVAGATKAAQKPTTGGASANPLSGGPSRALLARSGGAVSATVGGSVRLLMRSYTGGGQARWTTSQPKSVAASKTSGGVVAYSTGSGPRAVFSLRTGGGQAAYVAGSPATRTVVKAGGVFTDATGGGTWGLLLPTRTAGAVATLRAGGPKRSVLFYHAPVEPVVIRLDATRTRVRLDPALYSVRLDDDPDSVVLDDAPGLTIAP
jgi:hypothetical protein